MTTLDRELGEGTVVAGFRLERLLGRGSRGVVYEATQLSLERPVALKLLRHEFSEDEVFVARFRREGRLQAGLDHPGVLPVYEAGKSEHGLFIAMRLVRGRTLAGLLADGPLEPGEAIDLLRPVAGALDAAHAAGLVHRDVKPQNVLVEADGRSYLTDLGLSKTAGDTAITASGPLLGTVAYLAPEVVRGQTHSAASDRYAFSAMLFECLAGVRPFVGANQAEVLEGHVSRAPPRLSAQRPGLPTALDAAVARGLSKHPDDRAASASEIVEAAARALGLARVRRPRRRVLLLGGAAALALSATAVLLIAGGGGELRDQPAPAVRGGALPLGSDLAPGAFRSVDCTGAPATLNSPDCTMVQMRRPGSRLAVRRPGAIRSWAVRGASGELALQVIRRHRDKYLEAGRSRPERVPDEGVHVFKTDLDIQPGDRIGLVPSTGAAVGVRSVKGATLSHWFGPVSVRQPSSPVPGSRSSSGFELLLRADYVPGAKRSAPSALTGRAAALAPAGQELGSREIQAESRFLVRLAAVRLEGRIYIDLFRGGRRAARIAMPDADPGGSVQFFETFPYRDDDQAITLWWRTARDKLVSHDYLVKRNSLRFLN